MDADFLDNVKWLGHASFLINNGSRKIYIDPYKLKDSSYGKADIIFITHPHFDHCDPESVKLLLKPETVIVASAGCREKLTGINSEIINVVPNNQYEVSGLKFRTVPAYNNIPGRTFHQKSNGWVGYIINVEGKLIYHSGDSDCIDEMKSFGKVDVALLPIGGTYTMDAAQAAEAANRIGAKITVPMHFKDVIKGDIDSQLNNFTNLVKNSKVIVLK